MAEQKQVEAERSSFVELFLLTVDVIEAKDLKAADLNGFSDPYCKVIVFGKDPKEAISTVETPVIKKNLNPKWNTHHLLSFIEHPTKIVFELWDKDEGLLNGKDDPLGKLEILVNNNDNIGKLLYPITQEVKEQKSLLLSNPQIDKWFSLKDIKKPDKNAKGELKIKLKGERLFPMQTEKRLQRMINEYETIKNEKDKMKNELNQQIATITQENDEITNNLNKERVTNEELTRNKNDLTQTLQNKNDEYNKLNNKTNELAETRAKLEERILNAEFAIDEAKKQMEDLKTQNKGLLEKKKEVEKERDSILQDKNDSLLETSNVEESQKDFEATLQKTTKELDNAIDQITSLETDNDNYKNTIHDLKQRIRQLQSGSYDNDDPKAKLLD